MRGRGIDPFRAAWKPTRDRQWLSRAEPLDAASAWSAAAAWTDADPDAAAAMGRCESRLRDLQPYGLRSNSPSAQSASAAHTGLASSGNQALQ